MATVRSNIPHGSILASLRQRQQEEFAAAEQKKKQKAAFTNQMIQLGGMAAGAALGGPLGVGVMAGAGLGATGGGLLGNAMTGTPVSMNQGVNALMQVGGLMDRQDRTGIAQQRENRYAATGMPESLANFAPTIQNRNQQFGVPTTPMSTLSPTDATSMGMFPSMGGGYNTAPIAALEQAGREATWYENNPGMGDYNIMNTQGGNTAITREIGNRKSTIEDGIPTKIVEKTPILGGTETRTFTIDKEAQNLELTEIENYLKTEGLPITPANIAAVRAMLNR